MSYGGELQPRPTNPPVPYRGQHGSGEQRNPAGQALATEADEAPVDFRQLVSRLRANWVLAGGLLLIIAQVWLRAGLVTQSFYRFDDYFYMERAAADGLTWKYLGWTDAGHLIPLGSAITWVTEAISPENWSLTSVVTLALMAGASLAILRMLRVLFGDRPGVLVLLTIYVATPIALPGLAWWIVSAELLPLQIALASAITAHAHFLRTRSFRHAVAAACWLAVGMLASARGAAGVFLLFAITSAFFTEGGWLISVWRTLRDLRWAWLLYTALTAAYVVLYLVQLRTSTVKPSTSGAVGGFFTFAETTVTKTLIPGAFGGPWHWAFSGVQAATDPPGTLVVLSCLLAAGIVIVSCFYRRRAWRAWAIFAAWVLVVDLVPVWLGRSVFLSPAFAALTDRYVWDATLVLVLCLGFAFMGVERSRSPEIRHARRRLGSVESSVLTSLVLAIVVSSLWTSSQFPQDRTAAQARTFIATARVALTELPAGAVIVDVPAPPYVLGGQAVGSVVAESAMLAPLFSSPAPRFESSPSGTQDHLLEFNGFGQLVAAVVYGDASAPGPSCEPESHGQIIMPMRGQSTDVQTLRIGYIGTSPGQMTINYAGRTFSYSYLAGEHAVYFPTTKSGGNVTISVAGGASVCVGDAEAGVFEPYTGGTPIPPVVSS